MVQQTIDSKLSDYRPATTESGFPKHDKQQRVPLAANKPLLRDLQNEIGKMVAKSVVSSQCMPERGPVAETLKVSGTKRTQSECLVKSSRYQSSSSKVNGYLVYVRRKPRPQLEKRNTINKTTNRVDYVQARQHNVLDEKIHQQSQAKNSRNCSTEALPVPRASSESTSSTKPSVSLEPEKSNIISPQAKPNVIFSPPISSLDYSKRSGVQYWEDRYVRLQNSLRILDQSNQEDYLQMLRSLSLVDLCKVAIELEKRSIQLSLVEAKEVKRVLLLDVLGKYLRKSGATLTQQDQSEK